MRVLVAVVLFAVACASPASAQESFQITASAGANVRRAPATNAPILVALPKDATVPFLERSGAWVKVEVVDRTGAKTTGFIFGTLGLVKRDSPDTAPGQPVGATPEPTRAAAPPPMVASPPPSEPVRASSAQPAAPTVKAAQAPPSPAFIRREPVVALVLSLVFPGIGQLYNGPTEAHKGFIMMAAGAGAIAVAVIGASRTCSVSDILNNSCGTSPLLYVGYLAYLGDTVYSAYDGYSRAGELNKEHGFAFNVRPEVVAGRTGVRAEALYRIKW